MGTVYRSKDSRSSKFTAHAAVKLQRRHNPRYDGAAADQLLEELNGTKSVELKRLVHKTFPTCNVDLIHVVNAPQMYGMYLLRKEEMCLTDGGYRDKELTLYHVTTKSRALESLISGLDWRRTRRSKFGRGVSFSDDADYANYYADKFTNEDSRVIIVCAVLVNIKHRVSGKHNEGSLIVPPDRADTTVSPNGRVYVKYNDYDFYPLNFIYYQRRSEHLNESKYFHSNPHNKWYQNNRVMQQQELEAQRKREEAQRERDRAQERRDRAHELQEQLKREQASLAREQAQHARQQVQRALRQAQRRLERDQAVHQQQLFEQTDRAPRPQVQTRQRQRNRNCCLIL